MQYDTRFRVSADYDFTARLIVKGIDVAYSRLHVAKFELGGLSETNAHRIAIEAAEVQRTVLKLGVVRRSQSRLKHLFSRFLRIILATHVAINGDQRKRTFVDVPAARDRLNN